MRNRKFQENGVDERVVTLAREALGASGALPEALFSSIHEAAVCHAAGRRSRWVRWWGLWRTAVVGAGGAAVAALTLVLALPERLPPPAPNVRAEDLPGSTLALMVLAEGEENLAPDDRPALEILSEYLLRMQEQPGGFEEAHTLYAASW